MEQKLNIIEEAKKVGKFTNLTKALMAADMIDILKGNTTLTVFAPTDEAFDKLPAGTFDALLRPENKDKLRLLLGYHIVRGNLTVKGTENTSHPTTLIGHDLNLEPIKNGFKINDAKIISPDLVATNGCIHAIDKVLVPQPTAQSASAK